MAVEPKIICRTQFVHLHISESTPGPSGTQRRTTPGISQRGQPVPQKRSSGAATAVIVKNLAVCLPHTLSEICPNIHFVFFPAVSGPKKRKRQAITNPDSDKTSSSDSDSTSTVDTTSEGEDEKDFILSASVENLSTGLVRESHAGRHTVPSSPLWSPKYPRPHQQPEHPTFLPRAVHRRRFLGAPVPNKPASRAGQAIQACFILREEF